MQMKASNLDRILAGALFLAILILGMVQIKVDGNPVAARWTTGILLPVLVSGFRYNPTGWWAQYKWFGDRIHYFVDEGVFFVPWFLGFTHLKADCREVPTEFDNAYVFTKDTVEFVVRRAKIVWQIANLNLYFNLASERGAVEKLLDDVFDQLVRQVIRENDAETVLGMQFSEEELVSRLMERWGIKIVRIIVPEPVPTSAEVRKALEAKMRETLERAAQMIEGGTFNDLVALLTKPKEEGGAGLSHSEAVAEAKLVIGQAQEKMETIRVDGDGGTALVASILGKGVK